jgi:serine/threonine protein kinase
MPVTVQCPNANCLQTYSVPDTFSGRGVKCKKCGTPFKANSTYAEAKAETNTTQSSVGLSDLHRLPFEFGRYRITKKLGQGGMGTVYIAEDINLGRQVALKLPSFGANADPVKIERFVREARSSAILQHPNICTVFDAGQIDGKPFISMALIDGKELEHLIDPARPMTCTQAATLTRKIALALAHAHQKGIIHRDLKPANVMVTAENEPVVMDFGLAKRVNEFDEKEAKLTQAGAFMGTPSYMSPEQVRGEIEKLGPATDIYSLGVMLFEMLTGRTPYQGPLAVMVGQILTGETPRVSQVRKDVDPELDEICYQAMAKEIGARTQSMSGFAGSLDSYLNTPRQIVVPTSPVSTIPVLPPPVVPVAKITTTTKKVVPPPPLPTVATATNSQSEDKKGKKPLWIAGTIFCLMTLAGAIAFSISGNTDSNLNSAVAVIEKKVTTNTEPLPSNTEIPQLKEELPKAVTKIPEYPVPEKVQSTPPTVVPTKVKQKQKNEPKAVEVAVANIKPEVMVKPEVKPTPAPTPVVPKVDLTSKEISIDLGKGKTLGMVRIPKGTFKMGSFETEGADNEHPEHEVTLTQDFYMSKYEISQEQWEVFASSNPSKFRGAKLPVESMSWIQCDNWISSLNRQLASRYGSFRLPSEAEWEYACRAGSRTKYHFGDVDLDLGKYAWFVDNSNKQTHEVGLKKPNAFGLYDMHGNVLEWCIDWHETKYEAKPVTNPMGRKNGYRRTLRGGSFDYRSTLLTSAARSYALPNDSEYRIGFRLVLPLPTKN